MWNFIISLIQCPPNRQADTGCTKYLRIKHIFMHGLTLYLHKEAESSLCTFIAEHNCSLQDHCHHHIHCPPIFPAKKGRMTALRQISPTRMHPTVKQFIWHRHTINFQFEGAYPTFNVHKTTKSSYSIPTTSSRRDHFMHGTPPFLTSQWERAFPPTYQKGRISLQNNLSLRTGPRSDFNTPVLLHFATVTTPSLNRSQSAYWIYAI